MSLIDIVHSLEKLQSSLRVQHQFEAARSLNQTIDLLRIELELAVIKQENSWKSISEKGSF